MNFYLSKLARKDLKIYTSAGVTCLQKLMQEGNCIQDILAKTQVEPLKGWKPTVWRMREGDFRLCFTLTQDDILIQRFLPRERIYIELSRSIRRELDANCLDANKCLHLHPSPDEALEEREVELVNSYYYLPSFSEAASLSNYIQSSQFTHRPLLNSFQKNLISQIFEKVYSPKTKLVTVQGSAGTGKTTCAIEIAYKAIEETSYFPLILVPTPSLKKSIAANLNTLIGWEEKESAIGNNLRSEKHHFGAVLTFRELFKDLAGDQEQCLDLVEGNQYIFQHLERDKGLRNRYLGIDLYSISQGLSQNENYFAGSKDAVWNQYQLILDEIDTNSLLKQALNFQGRDIISQAKRAYEHREKALSKIRQLIKENNKKLLLIVDEAQDLYWKQMEMLLWLADAQDYGLSLILLGDENQRISISGFSWSGLDQNILQNYEKKNPDFRFEKGTYLNNYRVQYGFKESIKNLRNTCQIAEAARYILREAFPTVLQKIPRPPLDPGDPQEVCSTQGILPQLIEVNKEWLERFILSLQQLGNGDENKYVIVVNKVNSEYDELVQKIQNSHQIFSLSLSEVKGQEFDAVIYIHPFITRRKQILVDDLYCWYTALTRAKSYEYILVSPAEMTWLKENIADCSQLNNLFDYRQNPEIEGFLQEIVTTAKVEVTQEQRKLVIAKALISSVIGWLQGKGFSLAWQERSQAEKISFWDLLEFLEDEKEKVITQEQSQTNYAIASLNNYPKDRNLLAIYLSLVLLGIKPPFKQIFQDLRQFFQDHPTELTIGLQSHSSPIVQCTLLRCSDRSWDAAQLAHQNGLNWITKEVCQDLVEKKLPLEATRIQALFGDSNQPLPQKIPYPDLCKTKQPLVIAAIEQFIQSF